MKMCILVPSDFLSSRKMYWVRGRKNVYRKYVNKELSHVPLRLASVKLLTRSLIQHEHNNQGNGRLQPPPPSPSHSDFCRTDFKRSKGNSDIVIQIINLKRQFLTKALPQQSLLYSVRRNGQIVSKVVRNR